MSYPTQPSSPTGNPHLLVVGKDNRAADNAPDAADRDVDSLPSSRQAIQRWERNHYWFEKKNMVVSTVKTNCGSKCTWNPNGAPCFDWKKPCFQGSRLKIEEKQVPGISISVYTDHIYIYTSYICVSWTSSMLFHSWYGNKHGDKRCRN